MAEYAGGASIGARIKAARRARGFRTAKDLADSIVGGKLTEAIIENIEAGRKADLSISQLFNIAMALKVPVSFLAAPMARINAPLDLPNLSADFDGMTSEQFDGWISSTTSGAYRVEHNGERNDRAELALLRELQTLTREQHRLQVLLDLSEQSGSEVNNPLSSSTSTRLADLAKQRAAIEAQLHNAGWKT